ncbi:hypothetical protein M1N55_04295 [Dehalococcoidia bacterium]|nr:hypothetical protein [Dehalococcoidia bacterium]
MPDLSLPYFLLHGTGVDRYDELIIFAFLGGVALVLLGLSWRRGREKERSKKRKKQKK